MVDLGIETEYAPVSGVASGSPEAVEDIATDANEDPAVASTSGKSTCQTFPSVKIDSDSEDPGFEPSRSVKTRAGAESANESFLEELFRVRGIARVPEERSVKRPVVALE